jgi:hypothetical protein
MKICESCQHRIKYSDAFYCELTGKLIAIDDFDCVNHEEDKALFDIPTGLERNA